MADPVTPFRPLKDFKDSRFFDQIKDTDLKRDVERVTGAAADIARYVVAGMPQFTDHGERHFLNVLSYMEYLAGEENVTAMSQLECALAIMAAYTHDLGMVFTGVEQEEMDASKGPRYDAWNSYLETHSLKPRLDREKDDLLQRSITAQIRTDFLRQSHTDYTLTPHADRITEWLRHIKTTPAGSTSHTPTFTWHGFDYLPPLAWLGLSHGQPIHWLQQRLAAHFRVAEKDITDHQPVAGQPIHWLYLGWLLRLADVMDLDASRTPAILFDHIGIADSISRKEWLKHLALPNPPQFHHQPDERTLHYTSPQCPSPEVECAIAATIGWINEEITKVHAAQLDHPSARLRLELPSQARYSVTTRAGDYIYQDVQFTIQRDAVMELLMGEALYGEPTIALRELVQNALDALQMRKLRHDLRKALRKAGKSIDHLQVDPVEDEEELKVYVTWGTATDGERAGQRYIRVTDNGTGMDLATVRRFLTQIGRSYYKSDAYRREVEEMRQHGILCTTISQFGIGFLSSFMLADHITVRTRAAGATPADLPLNGESPEQQEQHRFPLRVEINRAHGLIAFYPDNDHPSGTGRKRCDQCGTEVTLWLKEDFDLAPWNPERIREKLCRHFYDTGNYPLGHDYYPRALEPAFNVASYIIWPLFPVQMQAEEASAALTLTDDYHFRELLPLNGKAFAAKAVEWDVPLSATDTNLHWHFCDWVDAHSADGATDYKGTGSRIRLAIVRPGPQPKPATLEEWTRLRDDTPGTLAQSLRNMLMEPQLPQKFRSPVLITGMHVPDKDSLIYELQQYFAGAGAVLWLDLRGSVSPRLRADRGGFTLSQTDAWRRSAEQLQVRWSKPWQQAGPQVVRWSHHALSGLTRPASHSPRDEWRIGLLHAKLSGLGVVQESSNMRNPTRDRDLDSSLSDSGGLHLAFARNLAATRPSASPSVSTSTSPP